MEQYVKIELGKIAYASKGVAANAVDIEIKLRTTAATRHWDTLKAVKNGPVFSAVGGIWEANRSDYVACGQIIDEINEYIKTPLVNRICEIWKRYHLNDMECGTKTQSEAIEKWEAAGNKYDYTQACIYLKSIGLYEDRGYIYGSDWLYAPIPSGVLNEIEKIIKGTWRV